ncbi:MAG: hypothetical protein ABIU77_00600 [Ferruginibacter sp.]
MKFLSTFLFLLYSVGAYGQSQPVTSEDSTMRELLEKIKTKSITAEEKKKLTAIAYDVQNNGQTIAEQQHDYKGALELTSAAINLFKSLNDTTSIANNQKFKGYLLGRLGNYSEAKKEISNAIKLYKSLGKEYGVAVSHFDLAMVYESENKIDSAIYYTNAALDFWQSKSVGYRIFGLQTMLTNLYTKSNELAKAKSFQQASEKLLNDPDLHWQNLIDYYFVSEELYKKEKNNVSYNHYKDLYTGKIAELKQQGITGKSLYDNRAE